MKTLKNLLVAALITLPVVTLNAGTIADVVKGTEMRPLSVANCCNILIGGKWYCLPC
jgi:hypothetical protein